MNRVLAIDFGEVRVGLALSDLTCTIARPYKTINYNGMDHLIVQLSDIIKENDVNQLVVGIPYNMKGEDTKQTKIVKNFVLIIEEKLECNVNIVDERLTSTEAEKFMHQMAIIVGHNKDKIDKIAASIILQEYLETYNV